MSDLGVIIAGVGYQIEHNIGRSDEIFTDDDTGSVIITSILEYDCTHRCAICF